ncbi:MAG TPA: prolipoprotein diacylglyceryl transferase family protein [Rhizomicrobium sp.]|nr:prolipoprotein diacylglyceryl transferase family protein [Rhizomicrobium sp.]
MVAALPMWRRTILVLASGARILGWFDHYLGPMTSSGQTAYAARASSGRGTMLIHTMFDLLAWPSAGLLGWWIGRRGWLAGFSARPRLQDNPWYFISLALGALAGAVLFGSFNMNLAGLWTFGHSIAGAIAGGVVAIEIYKWLRGIRGSTGLPFVGPLALGIAVGRLGCFFAGLPDYTYGTATHLPWGVDFGDGIRRHPVQLYESAAMLLFLIFWLRALATRETAIIRNGFYLFVAWYALQRFAWEFLKPYPAIIGPFNLFHLICIALLAYSIFMIRGSHDLRAAV